MFKAVLAIIILNRPIDFLFSQQWNCHVDDQLFIVLLMSWIFNYTFFKKTD